MKTKHTSGPWYAFDFAGFQVLKSEPYYDSGVDLFDIDECPEAKQNAKLSAAAPDLLNACQKFILFIQDGFDYNGKKTFEMLNEVEEAIKKATE